MSRRPQSQQASRMYRENRKEAYSRNLSPKSMAQGSLTIREQMLQNMNSFTTTLTNELLEHQSDTIGPLSAGVIARDAIIELLESGARTAHFGIRTRTGAHRDITFDNPYCVSVGEFHLLIGR